MKYTFKEKQKHFSELKNAEAAASDLELLRQKNPNHPSLSQYARNPRRYSDDILYTLLDFSMRDEIRNNRRKLEESDDNPQGNTNVNPEGGADGKQDDKPEGDTNVNPEGGTDGKQEGEGADGEGDQKTEEKKRLEAAEIAKKEAEEIAASAISEKEEAELRAQEAEESLSEAELRAEQAEEASEEAEERAQDLESALEEEKKKVETKPEVTKKPSKSKTNTRKSTGTTSSTRKSK
ncbi:MAG: hypothetical protein RSH25_14975 [Bacteroides sp.]|uniref:hypothetical protein n=1 Tax=Bacteroides sp. TaxID=29523 RepID=UPI002FC8F48F